MDIKLFSLCNQDSQEAEKGKPMLLFFHNPIYTPALYEEMRDVECCYAVGTPPEKMDFYSDYRYRQQIATPQTRRFLSTLFSLKNVKAIFAGHLHRYFLCTPTHTARQAQGADRRADRRRILLCRGYGGHNIRNLLRARRGTEPCFGSRRSHRRSEPDLSRHRHGSCGRHS